jgi:HEAT repeat protein
VTQDFDRVLDQLDQDKVPDEALYKLSNLHGQELRALRKRWAALDAARRRAIAARLAEITEADFEVDFSELFRLGLDDENQHVRVSSIEGLWEVEDVALIRPLIHLMEDDPALLVREAAALSLSRFALLAELGRLSERLKEMVWEALYGAARGSQDLAVRRRAIESLAYFDRPEVTAIIQGAYENEETKMRVSALFAMGRTADDEWANVVMAELESQDPELRYEATRACGDLGLVEATPILSQLIADPDPEIKSAAVWSLGQIGTPEAQRVLEICAEQGDEALQYAAEQALEEIDFMRGDLDFPLYDFDPDLLDGDEDGLD